MSELTHFNTDGHAHMVDIGDKTETKRIAIATGEISMLPETFSLIVSGGHKKGDVLGIARIAAIMGSKQTANLIPLCHPIALTNVEVEFNFDDVASTVLCSVRAETRGKTGVEMEALTALNVALLTIYDMCKAVDRGMLITNICLQEKSGGKSGHYQRS